MHEFTFHQKALLFALVAVGLIGAGLGLRKTAPPPGSGDVVQIVDESSDHGKREAEKPIGVVIVHVSGKVRKPGVYRLPPGSIVADAIAIAGGAAADADLDRLNKAVDLQDGSQVYVPRRGETRSSPPDPAGSALVTAVPPVRAASSSSQIDLNTAALEELDKLPGIGPALAQRIVEGRPYGAIEELLRVKGIGHAVYDEIKDLIAVR